MTDYYIPRMAITTRQDLESWIPIGGRMTIVEVVNGYPFMYSGVRTPYAEVSGDEVFSDLHFFFMKPDSPDKHEDVHAYADRNIDAHNNESFVFRYEEPAKNYVALIASKNAQRYKKRVWKPPVVTPAPHNPTV